MVVENFFLKILVDWTERGKLGETEVTSTENQKENSDKLQILQVGLQCTSLGNYGCTKVDSFGCGTACAGITR